MYKVTILYIAFIFLSLPFISCNSSSYNATVAGERMKVVPVRMILTRVETVGKNNYNNTWYIVFKDERGGIVLYVDGLDKEPFLQKGMHMQALIKY